MKKENWQYVAFVYEGDNYEFGHDIISNKSIIYSGFNSRIIETECEYDVREKRWSNNPNPQLEQLQTIFRMTILLGYGSKDQGGILCGHHSPDELYPKRDIVVNVVYEYTKFKLSFNFKSNKVLFVNEYGLTTAIEWCPKQGWVHQWSLAHGQEMVSDELRRLIAKAIKDDNKALKVENPSWSTRILNWITGKR